VAYYSLAIIGFSFLVEDHSIVDALYMATVIFTTIGYGDTAPDHSAARVYMIFLATYGVIILGIVLGILGDIIVEGQNVNTRARRRKLQQYFLGSMGRFNNANPDSFTEFSGTKASLSSEIVSTFLLEAPVVLIVFALGVMIGFHEGWTVLESIYWTVVSSYTIGFGDFAPESPVMRLFCVFFLPFSVAVFGEILSRIASVYMARKRSTTEQSFLHRTLTIHDLRILDKDGDGTVTRAEFLEYMLVALQKVDQEDIDELHNAFERLDSDQSGTLTAQDLVASLQSSRQLLTLNLVSL
jgi:potassium channel subfamily K